MDYFFGVIKVRYWNFPASTLKTWEIIHIKAEPCNEWQNSEFNVIRMTAAHMCKGIECVTC